MHAIIRAGLARDGLAIQIKLVILPVSDPFPLQHFCVVGFSDLESSQREDHGTHADFRLGPGPYFPAPRTFEDRRMNATGKANLMQDCVQRITQLDKVGEGQANMPFGPQFPDHFRKPYSLRIASRHAVLP